MVAGRTENTTNVEINYVPPERVEEFWPDVEKHISRAMDHSGGVIEAEDIKELLLKGKMLLWIISIGGELMASGVTQIIEYPRKSTLMVVCVGGRDFWQWVGPFVDALERYREELSVDCIRANCRDGMMKWLKELGWTRVMTLMER